MKKALILVDIQNCFCPPFGSLPVPEGTEIIKVANKEMLSGKYDYIIATQDSHPADHKSFAINNSKNVGEIIDLNGLPQIMWPKHAVIGTVDWMLRSDLKINLINAIVLKGTNSEIDSYSAFFDNGKKQKTILDDMLKGIGVTEISVLGLATDYCVKFTVLDGLELGYFVNLIRDGCRAVNINPNDGEIAIEEMESKGAKII